MKKVHVPRFSEEFYDYDRVLDFITKTEKKNVSSSKRIKSGSTSKNGKNGSKQRTSAKMNYDIDDFVIQTKSTRSFTEPTKETLTGILVPKFKEFEWERIEPMQSGDPDFEKEHDKLEQREKEYRFSLLLKKPGK